MCIRDSLWATRQARLSASTLTDNQPVKKKHIYIYSPSGACLLYTSDAADERSSVDLGGRRIIKKKKNQMKCGPVQ